MRSRRRLCPSSTLPTVAKPTSISTSWIRWLTTQARGSSSRTSAVALAATQAATTHVSRIDARVEPDSSVS